MFIVERLNKFSDDEKAEIIHEVEKQEEVKIISRKTGASSIDYFIEGDNAIQATRLLAQKVGVLKSWFDLILGKIRSVCHPIRLPRGL